MQFQVVHTQRTSQPFLYDVLILICLKLKNAPLGLRRAVRFAKSAAVREVQEPGATHNACSHRSSYRHPEAKHHCSHEQRAGLDHSQDRPNPL